MKADFKPNEKTFKSVLCKCEIQKGKDKTMANELIYITPIVTSSITFQ